MHGHAVVGRPRFEPVGQRQLQVVGLPGVGMLGRIVGPQQVVAGEGEQVGCLVPLLLPPRVEVPGRDDVGGDPRIVERVDVVIAHQQIAPAGPLLHLFQLGPQVGVVPEEMVAGLPVAFDEGMADEQFPGDRRVDLRVADPAPRHERQSVERDALERHHRTASGIPMRLTVGALDQVSRDPFDGFRLDPRRDPAKQPAGLHQVGDHDPARRLLGQHRTGSQHELAVAGAGIVAAVTVAQPDVGQQARGQRGVDARRVGRLVGLGNADVPRDAPQLPDQILPLPDPQIVQELLAAHPAERVARPLLSLLTQVAPQVEVRDEIRVLIREPRMLLPRCLLTVDRPFPRVGDGQRRGDDQHLTHATLGVGGQDHAADARIQRQPGQPAPDIGQCPCGIESTEFLQQLHAVADAARVGRIQERELRDIPELQGGHLQDDRREVGPQDLRIGVAGPGFEILLRIQPDAHAGRGAARPACPLRGRSLRDRFDRQALHLGATAVARDPRGAGVDDVADTRHRQRGLGDVGGQHDSPRRVAGLEDLLLICGRQPCIQR